MSRSTTFTSESVSEGHPDNEFLWEKTDKAEELRQDAGL